MLPTANAPGVILLPPDEAVRTDVNMASNNADDSEQPSIADAPTNGGVRQTSFSGSMPDSSPVGNFGNSYLDNVLCEEFEGAEDESNQGCDMTHTSAIKRTSSFRSSRGGVNVAEELQVNRRTIWLTIVDSRLFVGTMMVMTFYALFAPDLDRLFGTRETQLQMQGVTTGVCFLFMCEIFLQCMGKPHYPCKAHFWLDLISFISLLPETLLVHVVVSNNNAFVASRSTRVTQIVRIAARSSKAARLNRLSRIIRVAALMPRLQLLLGRRVKDDDAERLLEKKLYRIYQFLDEDMDGYVTRSAATQALDKIKVLTGCRERNTWASKVQKVIATGKAARALSGPTGEGDALRRPTLPGAAGPRGSSGIAALSGLRGRGSTESSPMRGSTESAASPHEQAGSPSSTPTALSARSTALLPTSIAGPTALEHRDEGSEELIGFAQFRDLMLSNAQVCEKLKKSCRSHLKQSNNMQNVTSSNSEKVGVKVALCVLLLLFVLTFLEPTVEDASAQWGIRAIDGMMRQQFPNNPANGPIPSHIYEQVDTWSQGPGEWGHDPRIVLYLALDRMVYCNELLPGDLSRSCSPDSSTGLHWQGRRQSLTDIDQDLRQTSFRQDDLRLLRHPEFYDEIVSEEQLETEVTAIALLNQRAQVEATAAYSILTTSLVIVIILTGITLLTKDLTFLSKNLLKPLVELADEMESITRLQLAGVSASPDDNGRHQGTSEIRLIRRTFDNMKKAIKSWGKYVPWPVVQLLLRKDAEANIEVSEQEVTIFFSDIASFTTIVEGLEPERSLLLLSRYFYDMSKIIDEYEGIVLEFIGDAIMAIYGAPVRNPDHPTAAVKSAVRMLASLRVMNAWFVERKLPEIAIRCGVHTGRCLVGNMGFQSRMKYGVVGEESDIPGRLEEMNKNYGTEMMISHATYSRIQAAVFIIRPIDYVSLSETPGAPAELVYQVLGRSFKGDAKAPKKKLAMAAYTAGLEYYRAKDWSEAIRKFEKVNDLWKEVYDKDDTASQVMIGRCKSYMQNPPPPGWDGIWVERTS